MLAAAPSIQTATPSSDAVRQGGPTPAAVTQRGYRINEATPHRGVTGTLAFDERGEAARKLIPIVEVDSAGFLDLQDRVPAPG